MELTITNLTGSTISAIYISPHESAGWEENLLGRDELIDGESVKVRFSAEEQAVMWDLRVENPGGQYAEWKNLNLRELSGMALRLNQVGKNVALAVAE